MSIARSSADNCNVELGERSGFKRFNHGITDFLRNFRRIDGGWYISMVRQLHVCLCTTTEYFNATTRRDIAKAFETCVRVHTNLRCPVRKDGLKDYQWLINDLLTRMVAICTPSTPSECKSIKFHWPRHWAQTRKDLGCSAMEKSLERKLGETHKKNFRFTNTKGSKEVHGVAHELTSLTKFQNTCTKLVEHFS